MEQKTEPLFSVLMANYNNGRYLLESVESVRTQTYSNWEIVIVDDGSTDCSVDVYQLLVSDERIHVYYNDSNHGCAWTKHRCASLARGKYCGYLDPDDVLLPEAIEVTVKTLISHPESVLSMSRYYFCDEYLNIQRESRLLCLKEGESYLEHHDYMPEVFAGWKQEAYIKAGGINTFYKAAVDQDLYFRLEEQGKIVVIDAFTYKYRVIDGSVSRDDRRSAFWNILARTEACERRGIQADNMAFKDFVEYCENEKRSGELKVRDSIAYKIGKKILKLVGK